MFDGLRKKLAKAANEDEEIIFRPYDERPATLPPIYFIDTEKITHIDSWVYSPPTSKRVIETVF